MWNYLLYLILFNSRQAFATLLVRLNQRQRIEQLQQHELRLALDSQDLSLLSPASSSSGSLWRLEAADITVVQSLVSTKDVYTHLLSSSSAQSLVNTVLDNSLLQWISEPWTIEYECLEPPASTRIRFSSKNLFCSLAQLIPHPPVLLGMTTDNSKPLTLTILDTTESIHLGWKSSSTTIINESISSEMSHQILNDMATRWAARPFIFSAALSIDIAALCVNILAIRLSRKGLSPSQCTFVDPCCGSGTTLYAAQCRGYGRTIGSDVNIDFVKGAQRNLEYASSLSSLPSSSTITAASTAASTTASTTASTIRPCEFFVKDAAYMALPWRPVDNDPQSNSQSNSQSNPSPISQAHAVCCNLPWNEALLSYHGETTRIIEALSMEMKKGCECAFVTKEPLDAAILTAAGLQVHDIIPIGGGGGSTRGEGDSTGSNRVYMDKGQQKKSGEDGLGGDDKRKKKTGDCYVTFCYKL